MAYPPSGSYETTAIPGESWGSVGAHKTTQVIYLAPMQTLWMVKQLFSMFLWATWYNQATIVQCRCSSTKSRDEKRCQVWRAHLDYITSQFFMSTDHCCPVQYCLGWEWAGEHWIRFSSRLPLSVEFSKFYVGPVCRPVQRTIQSTVTKLHSSSSVAVSFF